jgi:hypothetical protein
MARPIEPTPILKGTDKELFLKDIENVKYSPEKEKFLKECDEIYRIVSKKKH